MLNVFFSEFGVEFSLNSLNADTALLNVLHDTETYQRTGVVIQYGFYGLLPQSHKPLLPFLTNV